MDYRQEHLKAGDAFHAMWLCIKALTASVRNMPTWLRFDYLAPSAWASIGALAAKKDVICKTVSMQGGRLDSYKDKVKMTVDQQVELGLKDFIFVWKTSR
jgi:hypothetical protein